MKDFIAVVNAYKQIDFSQRKAALATVVRVHGSSYRSPGARMLITDDGRWTGSISGGCLEGDALRKARQVMNSNQAITVTYDTRDESNQNLGISLGCNGVIDVLIEPVTPTDENNPIKVFERFIHAKEELALATVCSAGKIGAKFVLEQKGKDKNIEGRLRSALGEIFVSKKSQIKNFFLDGEEAEVFLELIQPTLSVLIFGGGFDARPVSKLAQSLGWHVQVTDECVAHLAPTFFPDAKLSLCQREFVDRDFEITPYTACVLMSHNYEYDRDVLRKLINTNTSYIGILGPRKRFDKMQEEFLTNGTVLSESDLERIHSPIGLDIGAEAPDEIAVSIIAEIQAKFSKRNGKFLRANEGPIHHRDPESDQVYKRNF
ncbi:MAG TPA: XdhC family protein [Cyclobacteriaceae bacterium]|jgi:xanthine/CO dehydrogenase XdhC/CoxF family maturation factor|nr:XdhC family protein [Cyclobacteriaceae bacterium]